MKLIILDRDGVINHESKTFIKSPQEWIAIPGSLGAIAKLNRLNYTVVVCTNQSGIGRKLFNLETLNNIHAKMQQELASHNGKIDSIFYCPHTPDDKCNCRKPKAQMILDICKKYNLPNAENIMMVGDSLRDLQAISTAGGIPVLVKTGNGIQTLENDTIPPNTLVFDDLLALSKYLTSET